jgi:hypothetical protein
LKQTRFLKYRHGGKGQGGEMTKTMYAHVNKGIKKRRRKLIQKKS